MNPKSKYEIQTAGIVLIVIASGIILINIFEFVSSQFDPLISLFEKYEIDTSYYTNQKKLQFIINFVVYLPLLFFSIFTYKLKNWARIGLIVFLCLMFIYLSISPFLFNAALPAPTNPFSEKSGFNVEVLVSLFEIIIKLIGVLWALFYFSRKKIANVFK